MGTRKMFKKIILAFKFSPACRSALEKAIQLSIFNDAELFIFHALDYRLKGKDETDAELIELNQQMDHKFETEIKPLIEDFPKFKFGSSPSDPALEICRIAHQIQADLILLGCHDEPEKPRLARLDYVGVTILEKAPCPVILVPP
ncbi:MAG: universal stress protein [Desulfobacterales bacterium]|nr:MAG: universal stress protein [Desulfobacterales bacterium]